MISAVCFKNFYQKNSGNFPSDCNAETNTNIYTDCLLLIPSFVNLLNMVKIISFKD
jgi:hypothetical protein